MTLTTVNTGDTFYPSVLNQCINVLQQPAGGQEKGKYMIEYSIYTSTSLFLSCILTTLSRNSTPVSLSVDTSDFAPNLLGSLNAGHLTMGGAQIYAPATGTGTDGYAGGNTTMQY